MINSRLYGFPSKQRRKIRNLDKNSGLGGVVIGKVRGVDGKDINVKSNPAGTIGFIYELEYNERFPKIGDSTYAIPRDDRPGFMPPSRLVRFLDERFNEIDERGEEPMAGDVAIIRMLPDEFGYYQIFDTGVFLKNSVDTTHVFSQNNVGPYQFGEFKWDWHNIESHDFDVSFFRKSKV